MAECDVEAIRAEDRMTRVVRSWDPEPRPVMPFLHQPERPAEVVGMGKPPDCARPEYDGRQIDVTQRRSCAHIHQWPRKHLPADVVITTDNRGGVTSLLRTHFFRQTGQFSMVFTASDVCGASSNQQALRTFCLLRAAFPPPSF